MKNLNYHKGDAVAGYKLLQLLGTGESGEVWSAITPNRSIVALKIYNGNEANKYKAEYEYRMATSVEHRCILKPTQLLLVNEHPALVMPFCGGRSVDSVAGYMGERMIWQLIADISAALNALHEVGYGHFDVKPSNILWNGNFMLTDFGACRSIDSHCPAETAFDASSYRFDAPELNHNTQLSSDIWSLGATVFYLYMGSHVFNGLGGRVQQARTPLPYMRKSLPVLSELVMRCLAFNAKERPMAKEIIHLANHELERLETSPRVRHRKHSEPQVVYEHVSSYWPDDMIESIKKVL